MKKQELYNKVISYFQEAMPVAETELHYNNPFELLIAVILSAQCTDKRVNMITPPLYRDFPTPEALAASTPEVIYEYIRSVSYPNNKAKHLVGMAQMLVKDFHSEVPGTLEELVKLPGVGRKTANLILGDIYGKEGYVCDTHCIRITGRLGITDGSKDPVKVEQQLRKSIAPEEASDFCHRMVLHGRALCMARSPKCGDCLLRELCDYPSTVM